MILKAQDQAVVTEDNSVDKAVGQRLRERRRAQKISQSALANHLGVSFQQVQKYERGANRLSASMLVHCANFLETTVSDLIGETPRQSRGAIELEKALAIQDALELLALYQRLSDANRVALRVLANSLAGRG